MYLTDKHRKTRITFTLCIAVPAHLCYAVEGVKCAQDCGACSCANKEGNAALSPYPRSFPVQCCMQALKFATHITVSEVSHVFQLPCFLIYMFVLTSDSWTFNSAPAGSMAPPGLQRTATRLSVPRPVRSAAFR